MTLTSISAKDVKSLLHELLSKNKTQIITTLSLLCLPKKQVNGINSGVVCSLLKILNASNYSQSQCFESYHSVHLNTKEL
jgi:DNA-binding transcriptional ArsR family regulator